ncbi:MAG: hypothetical protein KFW21_02650 [Spirochaetota bacterium]|nr:hypothetical protein [Spirochaetota bacterium]
MRYIWLLIWLLCVENNYAQENSDTTIVENLEIGITFYVANFLYPAFDVDFVVPFYEKGISSLAFKTSFFTYIRGNMVYSPNFVMFGSIFELQYRLIAKNGLIFTLETGMGVVGEFFTQEIYCEENGFHTSPSIPYGIFSLGSRIGYDFSKKYNVPMQLTFVFTYRMQFPFNLDINNLLLGGINLSYRFDIVKRGKK